MLSLRFGRVQGFHITLSNESDIVARLDRGDVNTLNFCGFPIRMQAFEAKFEAAVYTLFAHRA